MRYFISKPMTHKLDEKIITGIRQMDPNAVIVDSIGDADVCVFQSWWTSSSKCITDYLYAKDKGIKCQEGYLYTDKYEVTLN